MCRRLQMASMIGIGVAEGEQVLDGLFAEEVVDAEDALLINDIVQDSC